MPIQSLELVGYKTFASKTNFDFADSITAIVGPNGSGKSNIADSIRWVLGEQSYSLLRGRKTVDMIFSGSEHRPRSGMAAATVVFNNETGWLPIDFAEVAITRRAYRDGQNEYLLNGQKVRLRDVNDLLGQAGLAERTYTIIGQGLVDAALSLRADERRKLFEEAAGIGVFRSRKEEAIRRLDATRRNLERVQDILAELKPRLRSLERQARRATEYDQVKLDLQEVLRKWYGYHWHRSQRSLKTALDQAKNQETSLRQARGAQTAFDNQISSLRARVHQLRGRQDNWRGDLGKLRADRERLERELAVAAERQRALESQIISVQAEIDRLDGERKLYRERLERSSEETNVHRAAMEEAAAQLETVQERLNDQKLIYESAEKELRGAIRAQNNLNDQILKQRTTLDLINTRRANQRLRLDELRKTSLFAGEALDQLATDLETAENDYQEATSALEIASTLGADGGETRTRQESELRNFTERRSVIRDRNSTLKARLEVLEGVDNSLAGMADGARLVLQALRSNKIQGTGRALTQGLEVRAGYELAVAAALGDYVNALIIGPDVDPFAIIAHLKEQAVRAALIPLSVRKNSPQPVKPQDPDFLGVGTEYIQVSADSIETIHALLDQVWVVRDFSAALRLQGSLPPGFSFVTLAGEILKSDGILILGRGLSAQGLQRPRIIKEIRTELDNSFNREQNLESQITALQTSLTTQRESAAELEQVYQTARMKEKNAADNLQKVRGKMDDLKREKRWADNQIDSAQAEDRSFEEEIQSRQENLEQLAVQKGEVENKVHSARDALSEISLEEFQGQVAHWTTRYAISQRAEADSGSLQQDRRLELTRLEERLASQKELHDQIKVLMQNLVQEQRILAEEKEKVGGQIKTIHELLEPVEQALKATEGEQESVQENEMTARRTLTSAERDHAQAQITLARRQEALDSLKERIEDDFGLVAFEYEEDIPGQAPLPFRELVESLPLIEELPQDLGKNVQRLRGQLRRMGAINPEARREYLEVKERFEFLTAQVADLGNAEDDILEAVVELDVVMEREFRKTFDEVAREFKEIFTRLFGGGSARLVMTDPDDLTLTGVDIEARLPGRRAQGLSLLSGGERSLTATALVLSLLKISPTPFCILDEVDAMLDEANVTRFADLIRELSQRTQFIIITHNRNTVQAADTIYGVTMGRDSTSQILGIKLDEVADIVA